MKRRKASSREVVRKRIVLRHFTGRLAGLSQILGVLEGTPEKLTEMILPSIAFGGPKTYRLAHHEKTLLRYIQYREFADVTTGQFNDFAPGQR